MRFYKNFRFILFFLCISNAIAASTISDTLAHQSDQERIMTMFPHLYTGHDKVPTALCDFMQKEWTNSEYDKESSDIKSKCFDELIPFARELSTHINGHADDFLPNMPEIKSILLRDLNHSIEQHDVSYNNLLLSVFRFQAAISPIKTFDDQIWLFNKMVKPLVIGLCKNDTWKDQQKSRKQLTLVYANETKHKNKLLTLPENLKLLRALERKLPLKLCVPVLNEGYFGIRLMIDHILDDRSLMGVLSFKNSLNADGITVAPAGFAGHDYLHYFLQQVRIRIPYKSAITRKDHYLNHIFGSKEVTPIITDEIITKYHLFFSYVKNLLKGIDHQFLSLHDRTLPYDLSALQDEYQKTMIGMFFVFHEAYFDVDDALQTDSLKEIVGKMKNLAKKELQQNLDITLPEQDDFYLNSFYSNKMKSQLNKKTSRVFKKDGYIISILNYGQHNEKREQYTTPESIDKKFKAYEDLLTPLNSYKPFSIAGVNREQFTLKQLGEEWGHIKTHLLECVDLFCDIFSDAENTLTIQGPPYAKLVSQNKERTVAKLNTLKMQKADTKKRKQTFD
jgi:hypothetical protein